VTHESKAQFLAWSRGRFQTVSIQRFLGNLFRWKIDHCASPVHPWSGRYDWLR
jgi:hypothetical protein